MHREDLRLPHVILEGLAQSVAHEGDLILVPAREVRGNKRARYNIDAKKKKEKKRLPDQYKRLPGVMLCSVYMASCRHIRRVSAGKAHKRRVVRQTQGRFDERHQQELKALSQLRVVRAE